jgi:hypothetical protein
LRWLLQLTAALKFFLVPDFYLFPKLKTKRCGRRYGSNEGVIQAVNEFFEDQNRVFYRISTFFCGNFISAITVVDNDTADLKTAEN